MSARLTVSQLIEALAASYQTIDIRLGAMQEKGTWINGITTLRLSRKSVDEVTQHHNHLLEKYGRVATEHFRVELMALPFTEWLRFLRACAACVLPIGDMAVKWSEPPKLEAEPGYIHRFSSELRNQDQWKWPSVSMWCGGKRPIGL